MTSTNTGGVGVSKKMILDDTGGMMYVVDGDRRGHTNVINP